MPLETEKAVERYCPDVDERVRREFFSRMDPEYFTLYTPEEVATHLRMTCGLDSDHPVDCQIVSRGQGIFDVAIVAFDYFSEFSILCGLLASMGLDIQSGHSYTFTEREKASGKERGIRPGKKDSRKKIVDLFRVGLQKGEIFDESRQNEFRQELLELILLLDRNLVREARTRVNRRVIEFLSRSKSEFVQQLYPVEIEFDNRSSGQWTLLTVRSKDTPGFLYSLTNALSMRGIYIHKVTIESVGAEVHDQIFLSDRQGQKIQGKKEEDLLRLATVLIKLFTHFLGHAPDPAMAMDHFDQMVDKIMEAGVSKPVLSLLGKRETLDLLARLLGASEFLWDDVFRMQFKNLLPLLQDFRKGPLLRDKEKLRLQLKKSLAKGRGPERRKELLNEFKDREMFRIDMKHLMEPPEDLMDFSRALTDLAEVVLDQAYETCHKQLRKRYGQPMLGDREGCPFAIAGLGKFGGRELGYASDLELLFVYGGPGRTRGRPSIDNGEYFEQLSEQIVDLIEARREGIFHVDVRLRPFGKAGALANSINHLKEYYSPEGEAAPFERQALTKLRWVAGDPALGRSLESVRDSFVYGEQPWDLKTALHLRGRQIRELVGPGTVNVKYSPGGVIDLEYAVQFLQLMHGRNHPHLRTTSTLEALEGLCRAQIISRDELDQLRSAYLFLRALIDGLRIVRGNARDLVLPGPGTEELKFLARRMGYSAEDWNTAAEELGKEIRRHMENAHHFFVNRFGNV